MSTYGKLHQLEGGCLAVRMDEVPWVKRIGFQQHILYEKQTRTTACGMVLFLRPSQGSVLHSSFLASRFTQRHRYIRV